MKFRTAKKKIKNGDLIIVGNADITYSARLNTVVLGLQTAVDDYEFTSISWNKIKYFNKFKVYKQKTYIIMKD